jgi:hypothetical protein
MDDQAQIGGTVGCMARQGVAKRTFAVSAPEQRNIYVG